MHDAQLPWHDYATCIHCISEQVLVELCPETMLWPPSRWDGEVTLYHCSAHSVQMNLKTSQSPPSMPIRPDQERWDTIAVTAWTSFVMYERHYLFEV